MRSQDALSRWSHEPGFSSARDPPSPSDQHGPSLERGAMKKFLILFAIVLVLVFGLSLAFAAPPGSPPGPFCPNNGGQSNGVCAKLGPCKGAAIDTATILGSSSPLRVCVFL